MTVRMTAKKLIPFVVSTFLFAAPLQLCAQHVEFLGVTKVQTFRQQSGELASLKVSDDPQEAPLRFEAFADGVNSASFSSISLTLPGGATRTVIQDDFELTHWEYNAYFREEEKTALDQEFPAGTYTFNLQTPSGLQTGNVTLASDNYPNVPFVTNYDAAQSVNPNQGFTLRWEPFSGGTGNDFIEVSVEELFGGFSSEVHTSPEPGGPGGLTGSATQYTIPANVFTAGNVTEYRVTLRFFRILGFTSVLGADAVTAYGKETVFSLITSGQDIDSPLLEDRSPFPGEAGVPTNSGIRFSFSEPMDTGINVSQAITWNGVSNPNDFSYSWNNEGDILFCRYIPGLPVDTTIGWTLNPNGSAAQLRDLNNNSLGTVSGSFTTASTPSSGLDVNQIFFGKVQEYFQSGTTPDFLESFSAVMDADLNGLNTVRQATLTGPGGFGPLSLRYEYGDAIHDEAAYTSKADMDRFLPHGTYTIALSGLKDGNQSVNLALSPESYPPAPRLTNLASGQDIDPGQGFLLTWDAWSGAGANDFIVVLVRDENHLDVHETPFPFQTGALPGTATSFLIPAGVLPSQQTINAEVIFLRAVDHDNTSYAGVDAMAIFATTTLFNLTTSTATAQAPELGPISIISGSQSQFRVTGTFGANYTVEGHDLSTGWMPINSGTANTDEGSGVGSFLFTDPNAASFSHRIYRARTTGN